MVYVPSKPPAVSSADGQALAAYLDDEMKSVAAGLRTSDFILFSISNKAPVKPRQGQLVYADGTNWNPGQGEGLYIYNKAGSWIWLEDNPVIPTIPSLPQGHIFGLTMSTAGSSSTLSVAAGLACDSTGVSMMNLSSSMAKTTSVWAAGTAAGGLDTGTIQVSKWYAWYVIENPTNGAVDLTYSLNVTTPAFPSGYTLCRRIGFALTNSSSQWVKFSQNGDEFLWDVGVNNVSTSPGTTAIQTLTVTTPLGVKSTAIMNVSGQGGAGSDGRGWIFSPDVNSAGTLANNSATINFGQSGSTGQTWSLVRVRTNTSSQLKYAMTVASGIPDITTHGWIDTRGRDA